MDLTHTVELFKEPKIARVERIITNRLKGRVFFEGTSWPAQVYGTTENLVGDYAMDVSSTVMVIGRHGLTLLVLPMLNAACA